MITCSQHHCSGQTVLVVQVHRHVAEGLAVRRAQLAKVLVHPENKRSLWHTLCNRFEASCGVGQGIATANDGMDEHLLTVLLQKADHIVLNQVGQ
ncbi:hypothetical protein D9M68_960930 [compost metagenome]